MKTWRRDINAGIPIPIIREALNNPNLTQADVFDLLNTHGHFKPSPEYGVFKSHKNWRSFSAKAMTHLEDTKTLGTQIYNQNSQSVLTIFDEVSAMLLDQMMIWNEQTMFYGTKAMQLYADYYHTDWSSVSLDMSTIDIDVAVLDPKTYSNRVFDYLVEFAKTHIYPDDIYITAVYLSEKTPDLYSVSIDIRKKNLNHYYLCKYDNVIDCSSMDSWTDGTYFKINEGVFCQTPLHYLCGIIDKLYNVTLNDRISRGVKLKALMTTKEKLRRIHIPIGLDQMISTIDTLVNTSATSQLTTFKNDTVGPYAYKSTVALFGGDVDMALTVHDEWLETVTF